MNVRLKYKKIEEYYLLIALGIALILRISYLLYLQPWNDSVISNEILRLDAKEYHDLANNVIANHSLENFGTKRTPGYPLFLALCYTLTGTKIWLVCIIQIILNLFSLIFVFRIAEKFFSRAVGIIVILFGALDYHQIVYCNKLMTETLFTFFIMGSLYLLSKYIL
jgi:4-amino-4-deoxy-L-arabinose transferase-like glycosyltransferase